ncbi:MAG: Hsp20/alpha crystallin family protein [Kiritimatiellaeota bacterium]|nr:Hsp20/alpha crystallin family protein [Kiritimatiellota bacterium]
MLWPTLTGRGWNPWAELERLQREMNRLFESYSGNAAPSEFPAVNIWTNSDGVVLTAEVPGIKTEDLDIAVQDDTVTIRGSRPREELKDGETWLRRERGAGAFVRSFSLPFSVDADKVTATYRNGVLELTLPRAEADKPKRIAVNTE